MEERGEVVMKRSKMIIDLAFFIRNTRNSSFMNSEIAEGVLKIIEENGMLPPTLEKVWMGHVIDEMNEWESEDECDSTKGV